MIEINTIDNMIFPRVIIENNNIIIQFNEETKLIWGQENNIDKAREIAKEIEMGLRSTIYIKQKLAEFVGEMVDTLTFKEVPYYIIYGAVNDALSDIYRNLPNITRKIKNNIKNR